MCVAGIVFEDVLRDAFIKPTLLRVVRIFRIGRVLRLIRAAKGIRKLLFAIIISLPALFNIGMLLLLIMFIYAIFGMTTFGNIRHTSFLDDLTNYETFFRSMILLFRLTTAGGWNDVLDPMMNDEDCNSTHIIRNGNAKEMNGGDCANPGLSIFFMTTYILITNLIIINMYIAVILENFNQAHEQEEVGITEDDFEMFYVVWERYDPYATQFIRNEQLSDFVADLEEPLGIPKPNEIALVSFDLPIMEDDRIHCLDILTALVRHVLGDVDEDSVEFQEAKKQMDTIFTTNFPTKQTQVVVSSTMTKKKEDVAARTLQVRTRQERYVVSMQQMQWLCPNEVYVCCYLEASLQQPTKEKTSLQELCIAFFSGQARNCFAELQCHLAWPGAVTLKPKSILLVKLCLPLSHRCIFRNKRMHSQNSSRSLVSDLITQFVDLLVR